MGAETVAYSRDRVEMVDLTPDKKKARSMERGPKVFKSGET